MNNNYKFIHLLYVPTMNCNMQCKYCYLKENTVDSIDYFSNTYGDLTLFTFTSIVLFNGIASLFSILTIIS